MTTNESMTPEIEHVWRQYHEKLRAFIRGRVGAEDADDILHELFLMMRAKLPQLENPDRLQSWLFRIASNAIIDHYRSKRPTEELPEWVAEPEADPAERAKTELSACLRPMIDELRRIIKRRSTWPSSRPVLNARLPNPRDCRCRAQSLVCSGAAPCCGRCSPPAATWSSTGVVTSLTTTKVTPPAPVAD